ncbi:MAG TPA: hypothetical protein VKV39_14160 [Candidatus Sulfotelmatobacter sp.]|nr:hypothetical protein [Candidatus Sulfotelmatobacter sp.]
MFAAIFLALSFPQTAIAPPPDSANEVSIYAELKKPLSSSIEVGHEIQLVVAKDVHRSDGAILIPHGAKLTAKITLARPPANDQPAALAFVAEKAEWKKQSMPLNASIDRVESMGIDRRNQDCLPDLGRAGGAPCGGVSETILGVPAECKVGKADPNSEENAVVCRKREVAFKSGAIIVLKEKLASSGGGAQPPDTSQRAANSHPYLELPLEQLIKRIPELKSMQAVQDQQALPMILSKSGGRVSDFLRQVVDLVAHEEITQESLDETGRTKSSRQREYSYLVLLHRSDLAPTPEEYRTDGKGNRAAPGGVDEGYAVTSGFAFECLLFLPANQPNSTFRFLGTEMVGGRNSYVVAFAQRPDAKTTFVNLQGVATSTAVQGVAWIDQGNFQLLRMRTDLLEPLRLSEMLPALSGQRGLERQTTEVTFGETHLQGVETPLWLPQDVRVEIVFNGGAFHNEHRYSDYKRFHVASKIVTQ